MKQRIVLLVALGAGILAFFLTHSYLEKMRDEITGRYKKIQVIVASRDLTAGTELTNDDLALSDVFERAVGTQVFKAEDFSRIRGKKLRFNLRLGDPVMWKDVDLPRAGQRGLAAVVKPGMRAVSLSIGGDAAVSNLVRPNDRVDILGTFAFPSEEVPGELETTTLMLLQDVSVLATGEKMGDEDILYPSSVQSRRKTAYSAVTFEVTPREAELLVFAEFTKGNLTLALRNPEDGFYEPMLPEVDFDHIRNRLEAFNLKRQKDVRSRDTNELPAEIRDRQERDAEIQQLLDQLRAIAENNNG